MKTIFKLLAICLLAAFPICAQNSADQATAQAAASATSSDHADQTASIAGTVVAADTGHPLSDARVMLVPLEPGRALPTRRPDAITDDSGHFAITNIRPGRFIVHIERDGYTARHFGSQNARLLPAVLILTAGQSVNDLMFKMLRPAVISGHVTDKDGEPLAHVTVQAYARDAYGGRTTFSMIAVDGTNDQGEYRIFGLSPGQYWVVASYRDEFGRSDGGIDMQSYPPVYYPKASSFDRATPLHVSGGEQIPDINFTLVTNPARGHEISGKVVSASSGQPVPAGVLLQPVGDPEELGGRSAEPGPGDGTFKFLNVPPGSYWLTAKAVDGSTASQQIAVVDADVHDVLIVFKPGIEITGHVTVEGKPASIGRISVSLVSHDGPDGLIKFGDVQADGTFTLKDVADGAYHLSVFADCDRCYLKSIRSGQGVDLLAGGVQVASGVAPAGIEVVYSANTAELDGTVLDDGGKPAEGAFVVVIPSAAAPNRGRIGGWSSTGQYGRFDVSGLAPGKYSVVAIQGLDYQGDVDFTAPDFIKPFGDRVQSIEVVAGDHKSLQLQQVSIGAHQR